MDPNQQDRIRALLDEVTALLPESPGRLRLSDDPDETHVVGDRAGLLRLGVDLARGAVSEPRSLYGVDNAVCALPEEICSEDGPFVFRLARDADDLDGITPPVRWRDKLIGWGCGLLALAAILAFIIGVIEGLKQLASRFG